MDDMRYLGDATTVAGGQRGRRPDLLATYVGKAHSRAARVASSPVVVNGRVPVSKPAPSRGRQNVELPGRGGLDGRGGGGSAEGSASTGGGAPTGAPRRAAMSQVRAAIVAR